MESDVKNNPKRKRQLLRKAVGEFKTLLTVKSSQKQRRTATNPLKFKETLKETTQKGNKKALEPKTRETLVLDRKRKHKNSS